MPFETEADLVSSFGEILEGGTGILPKLDIVLEFPYHGGRTDVIGVSPGGVVYAFEAKLRRWRECLNQAYRNTSFCHYSYVLLPAEIAEGAMPWREAFQKRGVGLCSVDRDTIEMHIRPKKRRPLQPWFTKRAVQQARGGVVYG